MFLHLALTSQTEIEALHSSTSTKKMQKINNRNQPNVTTVQILKRPGPHIYDPIKSLRLVENL